MPNEHLARVINVNFSTNNIETLKRNKVTRNKRFDLLSNSLNLLFKEIYRDQSGEFVCGY